MFPPFPTTRSRDVPCSRGGPQTRLPALFPSDCGRFPTCMQVHLSEKSLVLGACGLPHTATGIEMKCECVWRRFLKVGLSTLLPEGHLGSCESVPAVSPPKCH